MKLQIIDDTGLTITTEPLTAKQFKSGSRGFFASFKFTNGARYQTSVNVVEIGSKPGAVKATTTPGAVKATTTPGGKPVMHS